MNILDVKEPTLSEHTIQSISSITTYDLKQMPRTADLGKALSFENAVDPTQKIIEFFKRIPIQNLNELPDTELKLIKTTADSFYQILDSIENYNSDTLTSNKRDEVVQQIIKQYQPIFTKLFPVIAYLTVRNTDFSELESKARAATINTQREAENAVKKVTSLKDEADKVLATIRETAAEQGVSQQSIHFKTEADKQEKLSKTWAFITLGTATALGFFAISSLFLHKWSILSPNNSYETVQLALSKLLIFGVMSYMLILSARNFMAHKHNKVVNKHRQNALATFRPLVEAASIDEKQDIILDRASEAIFGSIDSGFTKNPSNSVNGTQTLLRMLPSTNPE